MTDQWGTARTARTSARRVAAGLVALSLLAAACGDDDVESTDEEAATSTTASGDATTTTSEETTTTTVAAEGPQEWVDVVRDLEARRAELYANPDLDALADLYAETCLCWDQHEFSISDQVESGVTLEPDFFDPVTAVTRHGS